MRPIRLFFNAAFQPQQDPATKQIRIPPAVLHTLTWWTITDNLSIGTPFRPPRPTMTLYTDASLLGWGAACLGLRVQGTWNRREARKHINFLELLAIFNALKAFETVLCRQIVQIASDNIVAVFYINKQGGTKSPVLACLSMDIWDWCIPRNITLVAVHLAGTENVEADTLSRQMSTTHEWELDKQLCEELFRLWGYPDVDLFATQQNSLCALYCSRAGVGPGSMGDALMVPWSNMTFYAFPPIPLLTRVGFRCKTSAELRSGLVHVLSPSIIGLMYVPDGTALLVELFSHQFFDDDTSLRRVWLSLYGTELLKFCFSPVMQHQLIFGVLAVYLQKCSVESKK
ncbi:Enzymatic polyprotein [Varanus komodoensis]|nr:Enzymatic polyprotein [Varanus komodoensis]